MLKGVKIQREGIGDLSVRMKTEDEVVINREERKGAWKFNFECLMNEKHSRIKTIVIIRDK